MKTQGSSGSILVIMVIMAALAGILASGIVLASSSSIKQAQRSFNFEQAFYAAEAGIERAVAGLVNAADVNAALSNGLPGLTNTVSFGDAGFSISLAQTNKTGDNVIIVTSSGHYQNAARTNQMELILEIQGLKPSDATAAFAIYGDHTELELQGNPLVDGHDWAVPPTFQCQGAGCSGSLLPANPAVAGIFAYTTNYSTSTKGAATIDGNPPEAESTASPNPSKADWEAFATTLIPLAHHAISGTVAGNDVLGTRDNPEITVITNNVTLTGNADGAGILIITAGTRIHTTGTFHYEGLVIIMTDGADDGMLQLDHTGTGRFFGSIISLGDYVNYKPHGKPEVKYSSAALDNLSKMDAFTLKPDLLTWREIKPGA